MIRAARWTYAAIAATLLAVLPFAHHSLIIMIISQVTLVPVAALVPRVRRGDRAPWALLAGTLATMTAANTFNYVTDGRSEVLGELLLTVSHLLMLAGAVTLVLRRGRHDFGGVADTAVGAIGLGGLIWTVLLQPRVDAAHVGTAGRWTLLSTVLLLAAVLGALVRLRLAAGRRLPSLDLLTAAIVATLTGDVVLIMGSNSIVTGGNVVTTTFFMASYCLVGLVTLHPSVHELARPGPAPSDRLSSGRLLFLGAALSVNPFAAGLRALLGEGFSSDVLALGTLLTIPLVVLRVGALARQQQRAVVALDHDASHDRLTGLPNRAELLRRLDIALASHPSGVATILLFCDLNGFKAVNDRLGHLAGDQLLIAVGERLTGALRARDTVARFGGDEFVVLCRADDGPTATTRISHRLSDALREPFQIAGEHVTIGTSVGAVVCDGVLGADDLIRQADERMYRAKEGLRAA